MEGAKSLVSVGIPTYNRPEGLRRTLNYITRQTYQNLEIIISDNCSTLTETEKVVQEFAQNDSRIKFYKQPENKGAFFNFSFVLEKAIGEYYMWAADDDEWSENFIEECIETFSTEKDVAIVMASYKVKSRNASLLKFPSYRYFRPYDNFSELSSFDTAVRIRYFILADELTHKANFIYGVWKRNLAIESWEIIDRLDFSPSTEVNQIGVDIIILTYALSKGRFILTSKASFYKYYDNQTPGGGLKSLFRNMFNNKIDFSDNYYQHLLLLKQVLKHSNIDKSIINEIITLKINKLSGKSKSFYAQKVLKK